MRSCRVSVVGAAAEQRFPRPPARQVPIMANRTPARIVTCHLGRQTREAAPARPHILFPGHCACHGTAFQGQAVVSVRRRINGERARRSAPHTPTCHSAKPRQMVLEFDYKYVEGSRASLRSLTFHPPTEYHSHTSRPPTLRCTTSRHVWLLLPPDPAA